jgi:hypothetical protein
MREITVVLLIPKQCIGCLRNFTKSLQCTDPYIMQVVFKKRVNILVGQQLKPGFFCERLKSFVFRIVNTNSTLRGSNPNFTGAVL